MADVLKILGQVDAAATTTTTLYTAPDLSSVTISSLIACNRSAGAITFRVSVHAKDAGDDDKQFIYFDKSVAVAGSFTAVLGLTLAEGDIIKVWASAIDMSFNLFGVETS